MTPCDDCVSGLSGPDDQTVVDVSDCDVIMTPCGDCVSGLSGPDDHIFDDIEERVSARRRPGETDMDYFERRYQERVRRLAGSVT